MANYDVTVKDDKLTITVDLSKTIGPSKSGKSLVIATSGGNVTIPGTNDIKLGLNVYRSAL